MSTPLLIDPNARFLIGHRGARAKAPENTIESLVVGMEAGSAEATELARRLAAVELG